MVGEGGGLSEWLGGGGGGVAGGWRGWVEGWVEKGVMRIGQSLC